MIWPLNTGACNDTNTGKACSVEGKQCIARALYGINNEIYGRCGFSGFHYYRVVGDDVRMHARREEWLLTSVVWPCGTSRCLSPVELRVVCVCLNLLRILLVHQTFQNKSGLSNPQYWWFSNLLYILLLIYIYFLNPKSSFIDIGLISHHFHFLQATKSCN